MSELRQIIHRKELLFQLTRAEIASQYKNKVFGFLWAILDPVFLMLTYWVLISYIFNRGGVEYPALLFVSVLSWRWFLQSSLGCVRVFTSNAQLMQTVQFPYSILPVSRNLLYTLNFFMGLLAMIPLMIFLRIAPTWNLLWLALLIPIQFLFNVTISTVFALIGVYFRDLHNILTFMLRLVFYLSPGLYLISEMPENLQTMELYFNPFSSLFESYKNIIVFGEAPSVFLIVPALIGITLFLWLNAHMSNLNRLIKDL